MYRKGHIVANPDIVNATDYGVMDNLAYTYNSGNKLLSVTDSSLKTTGFNDGNTTGNDYTYDANGNMITDANKGIINISYNHLNLPSQVTFAADKYIDYIYDASGIKLKKIVTNQTAITKTSYAGNYIYEKIGVAAEELKFFNQPEGYVEPDGSNGYNYIYQYKDHLGNIRLSYTDISTTSTPNLEIVEENNYYPFGLKHKGYNSNVSASVNSVAKKFGFNGIEMEESLGLNLMEMDFRQYDPEIGRFISIDPITHYSNSTYNGFDNNPVFWADPSGANSMRLKGIDGKWHTLNEGEDYTTIYKAEDESEEEEDSESENEGEKENEGDGIETKYVNRKGEVLVDVDDGSDAVYVVESGNESDLLSELLIQYLFKNINDAKLNALLGKKYGFY